MAEKKFLVKNGIKVFADAVIDSDITVAGTASITKGLTADTLTGQYLGFDSDMQNTTTNRLPEGTSNLYYTSTRVDSDIDGRVDSAYLAVLLPEYVTKTGAQTLTNKTLTDPILAGANFYNQTYSGFSVNYDLDFGDSTQTVYTFASDSTTTDAVLAVGIKGQTPTGFIAASQSEADLILGLPGTSTQFKIRNNTGHTPFGLDDGDGTDLVVMATDGKVNITNSTEATTKTSDTIKSNVITTLTNYNTDTLSQFDGVFRYSKITGLIDGSDSSILSNITTLKIRKDFTPTLASSTKYSIYFRNALYNPHSGHNATAGGILESSGFKVSGDSTTIFYLDDEHYSVNIYAKYSKISSINKINEMLIKYLNLINWNIYI